MADDDQDDDQDQQADDFGAEWSPDSEPDVGRLLRQQATTLRRMERKNETELPTIRQELEATMRAELLRVADKLEEWQKTNDAGLLQFITRADQTIAAQQQQLHEQAERIAALEAAVGLFAIGQLAQAVQTAAGK